MPLTGGFGAGIMGGEAPVEATGQFPVQAASSATATAYVGVIGVAPRTLVRFGALVFAASGSTGSMGISLYRAITGAADIAQALVTINSQRSVQAQCIGGGDASVLGASSIGVIEDVPSNLTFSFNQSLRYNGANFANSAPFHLYPGDAFVATATRVGGTSQPGSVHMSLYIAEFDA